MCLLVKGANHGSLCFARKFPSHRSEMLFRNQEQGRGSPQKMEEPEAVGVDRAGVVSVSTAGEGPPR